MGPGSTYTVDDIAKRYRRSPRTIRDWILRGCPVGNHRVKLAACKMGRSWMVSDEALLLFEHRVWRSNSRPDPDEDDQD